MDEHLQKLRRAFYAHSGPDDILGLEHFRLRMELVRAGFAVEAGLLIGDLVEVNENLRPEDAPWIMGPWFGYVRRIRPNSFRVDNYDGMSVMPATADLAELKWNIDFTGGLIRRRPPDDRESPYYWRGRQFSSWERLEQDIIFWGLDISDRASVRLVAPANPSDPQVVQTRKLERAWIARRRRKSIAKKTDTQLFIQGRRKTSLKSFYWMDAEETKKAQLTILNRMGDDSRYASARFAEERCACRHLRVVHVNYHQECVAEDCGCTQFQADNWPPRGIAHPRD